MARCRQCDGFIDKWEYPFTNGINLGLVSYPVKPFGMRRCSCAFRKIRRSIEEQLEQLVLLRDEGILTEEEFLELESRLTNGGNS